MSDGMGAEPAPSDVPSAAALRAIHEGLVLDREAGRQLGASAAESAGPGRLRRPPHAREGVIAAVTALRRREDGTGDLLGLAVTDPGPLFAMGVSPLELFRARLGRVESPTRGRCGTGAWSDFRRGLLGVAGGPGTAVQVMAGVALALEASGEDRAGMVVQPDASTSSGAWHEGFNLAAVRRCPLVLVLAAADDGESRRSSRRDFLAACVAYGVQGAEADGDDLPSIHREAFEALARARSGEGVQVLVLRGGGRGEALDRLRTAIVEGGHAKEEELDRVEAEIGERVARDLDRALAEESPPGAEALGDVWTDVSVRAPWYRTEGAPGASW